MKKPWIAVIAFFLIGLIAVDDAFADRREYRGGRGGHSRVGVGVVVGSPFWSPWYYPPHYLPYYPPYYPPVVIEHQPPPVYIEQSSPAATERQAGYWYYCQSPSWYYPEIRECSQAWVKIPPRP